MNLANPNNQRIQQAEPLQVDSVEYANRHEH